MNFKCPQCGSRDHVARFGMELPVNYCSTCKNIWTPEHVPGENPPEPVDSRPDPPPAPPEPSGHHDAPDNRITEAEAQAKAANIRCDVLVQSVVALQERVKALERRCDALAARPIGGYGPPC